MLIVKEIKHWALHTNNHSTVCFAFNSWLRWSENFVYAYHFWKNCANVQFEGSFLNNIIYLKDNFDWRSKWAPSYYCDSTNVYNFNLFQYETDIETCRTFDKSAPLHIDLFYVIYDIEYERQGDEEYEKRSETKRKKMNQKFLFDSNHFVWYEEIWFEAMEVISHHLSRRGNISYLNSLKYFFKLDWLFGFEFRMFSICEMVDVVIFNG